MVDGYSFRLDQGEVLHFNRRLNLRSGILRRDVRWRAPNGSVVDLSFERLISYPQEHIGAMRILATAVNKACRIGLATGINGNVTNEEVLHWDHLEQGVDESGVVWLYSKTRHSYIELATAASIHSSGDEPITCQQCPGHPRYTTSQELEAGQSLQILKIVSYASDRDWDHNGLSVIRRAMDLLAAREFFELRSTHVEAWRALWEECDVVIEGDVEAQIAARFSLFHLLIAAPQHDSKVSIGAKTLSGPGYRGHVFWDTEIFALPFFIYTQPDLARNMLLYRYHTLPGARRKAADNGYGGAQFAWESAATGDEVTPTWVPGRERKSLVRIWTGDIEIHITADVAYATYQYWQVTGDDAFMRDYGVELFLDTARFWGHRVELEEGLDGRRYALRDVIGPDEYHDHVDNNAYTNRLVQWHLEKAIDLHGWIHQRDPEKAKALDQQLELTPELLDQWQDIVDHIIFTTNLIEV
jgi:kojibiose phosphorylase